MDERKKTKQIGCNYYFDNPLSFEAQEMCDRIAIINNGNLVALDTTQRLLDRIQTKKITFKVQGKIEQESINFRGVRFKLNTNNTLTAIYEKNSLKFEDIIEFLKKRYQNS